MNKETHKYLYKYFSYIEKASEKKINICNFVFFFYSCISERTHSKLAFFMYT